MNANFTAFVIDNVDGKPVGAFRALQRQDLPDRDVLVEIACSTVNYKDGLAITGKGRIARKVPMVGGIDLAGTVVESRSPDWKPGDQVMVNGWGLSETAWGGYSHYQALDARWLMRVPSVFSLEDAMGIGTAGYTAALCVDALESWGHVRPEDKEVLVTGAGGGVGTMAIALLARAGYVVTASTGRPEAHEYLRRTGARNVIDRASLAEAGAPLQAERWGGAIDSVGGRTLVNVISQMSYGAAVASCGLASSTDLPSTVLPFILRGVSLLGIDSVQAPAARREAAWKRLARDLDVQMLRSLYRVEPFTALPALGAGILKGEILGRVVVKIGE